MCEIPSSPENNIVHPIYKIYIHTYIYIDLQGKYARSHFIVRLGFGKKFGHVLEVFKKKMRVYGIKI